ncbi:DUF3148 domain-containing protein [Vulcanococcus limneticus Candia 3F8]|nr:DUF3148 domain-containing protein [Vulcanococcus limneticus MW73D5]MCP9894178.1 DUF3148 domain-containing protein [Vulcanococcus limneticus Candia 3F8]MCP9897939.1 DUF3148 domain-containing protein [Vulcanococcus limneticus Candia 3B3]
MDGTAPEPQPTPTSAADETSPTASDTPPPAPAAALEVGAAVRLIAAPAYLKTADPMPMLRPPDLVDAEEVGQVVGLRALEQLAVRFRRGTFLLERSQLELVAN